MHAEFQKRLPRVCAFDAHRSQAQGRPGHIARGVRRLHGGDDGIVAEPGEVFRRDHLGVFHAKTLVVFPMQRGGVSQKNLVIRAISNGMRTHLEAAFDRFSGEFFDSRLLRNRQPAILWIVRVRRQQGRPARAECAIGIKFHTAHRQEVAYFGAGFQEPVPKVGIAAGDHGVNPNGQAVLLDQGPVGLQCRCRDSGVMNRGQPDPRTQLCGRFQIRFSLRGCFVRHLHQVHRVIDKYARGISRFIAHDAPARGVGDFVLHAGDREGFRIHPDRMPVHAGQHHRVIRRGAIE